MLIAKGYDIGFKLEGERDLILPPKSYAMLHDPSGSSWPKCSVLVAPFSRRGDYVRNALAKEYFQYEPWGGRITLPDRHLSSWKKVGPVKEIDYYWRPGEEYEGDWWHPFGEAGFLFKSHLPILYRSNRLLRLELGRCTLDWRGFVYP
jgi:hypothetical protein